MKNSKKGFITPLILIIIVILGIGGIYYFYLQKNNQDVDTSDWKTFVNSNGDYSIKYPSNYELEENSRGELNITNKELLYTPTTPTKELPSYVISGIIQKLTVADLDGANTPEKIMVYMTKMYGPGDKKYVKINNIDVEKISVDITNRDSITQKQVRTNNTHMGIIKGDNIFILGYMVYYLGEPYPSDSDIKELEAVFSSFTLNK